MDWIDRAEERGNIRALLRMGNKFSVIAKGRREFLD
jgi:hypothetical protein